MRLVLWLEARFFLFYFRGAGGTSRAGQPDDLELVDVGSRLTKEVAQSMSVFPRPRPSSTVAPRNTEHRTVVVLQHQARGTKDYLHCMALHLPCSRSVEIVDACTAPVRGRYVDRASSSGCSLTMADDALASEYWNASVGDGVSVCSLGGTRSNRERRN